jgi:hypothetical protein
MPRDPLAAVTQAAKDLAAAQAGVGRAQDDAKALVAKARTRESTARTALRAAIVAAAANGVRQVDLVRTTGMTREAVRRIVRAGGVEAD